MRIRCICREPRDSVSWEGEFSYLVYPEKRSPWAVRIGHVIVATFKTELQARRWCEGFCENLFLLRPLARLLGMEPRHFKVLEVITTEGGNVEHKDGFAGKWQWK